MRNFVVAVVSRFIVIPIQTPTGSIFGLQTWKANDLTSPCMKAPLIAIWSTWVSNLPPLLIAHVKSTNGWLCAHSHTGLKRIAQPIHLLYKVKGGGEKLEQSKGRVLRDQCIYIKHRLASLTHHFIRKHTFRDWAKSCDMLVPTLLTCILHVIASRDQ